MGSPIYFFLLYPGEKAGDYEVTHLKRPGKPKLWSF